MATLDRDHDPQLGNCRVAVSPPFAVCKPCRAAYTLHALLHHLQSSHGYDGDIDRFILTLEKRGVRSRFSVSPRSISPIPGISTFQGLQCLTCDHLFTDPDDFTQHARSSHGRLPQATVSSSCQLQDVYVSQDSSVLILVSDSTGPYPRFLHAPSSFNHVFALLVI